MPHRVRRLALTTAATFLAAGASQNQKACAGGQAVLHFTGSNG